jgi:hypothetical protein
MNLFYKETADGDEILQVNDSSDCLHGLHSTCWVMQMMQVCMETGLNAYRVNDGMFEDSGSEASLAVV